MKDGFVKVAAATPEIRVADCNYNADKIIEIIAEAERKQVACFPGALRHRLYGRRSFLHRHAARRSQSRVNENRRGDERN